MFVGHYSASFLAKGLDRHLPLWLLFVAVQLIDILWAIFILAGVEKVRIVPAFTRSNDIDLYFMPYTHSLPGAVGWSVLAFVLYYLLRRRDYSRRMIGAILIGSAVLSHWVLDVLVHTPDLPLFDNSNKIGFGLWNYPEIELPLELLLLFVGFWFYVRSTSAVSASGHYAMGIFVIVLAALQLIMFFSPPPGSANIFAVTAFVSYAAFAAVAFWLERFRS